MLKFKHVLPGLNNVHSAVIGHHLLYLGATAQQISQLKLALQWTDSRTEEIVIQHFIVNL